MQTEKNLTKEQEKLVIKSLIIFGIVTIIMGAGAILINKTQYTNLPERTAQVEIVEKRVAEISVRAGRSLRRSSSLYHKKRISHYYYIVAFKLPDGTIKEMKINKIIGDENLCPVFEALEEGDKGKLTYKEKDKQAKTEDQRRNNRLFLSFEKNTF
jgi:hypothetical protein